MPESKAITDILVRHPRLGIRTDEPGIRRVTTTPYPYLIFYEIAGEEIIVHGSGMGHATLPVPDWPRSQAQRRSGVLAALSAFRRRP
jgi:hypothetical protein